MNDSENQVIRERFNVLKEKLDRIKNEDINLDEAGIKELSNKISTLVEMENDVKSLVRVSTEKYDDQELLEYTSLMGEVNEYITSLNIISDKLKDAQRSREKIRNKLIEENEKLNNERLEYDYKISDTNEKTEIENQVLGLELSNVDREYHESLLSVYKKYIDALNEERKPFDEKYDSYSKEIDLLINGGSLNYQLNENGDLEKKEMPEIKEIELPKEEVVNPSNYEYTPAVELEPVVDEVPEEPAPVEETVNPLNHEYTPTAELEPMVDEVPEEPAPVEETVNPSNYEYTPTAELEPVVDEVPEEPTPVEETVNPLNHEYTPTTELEPVVDEVPEEPAPVEEVVNPLNYEYTPTAELGPVVDEVPEEPAPVEEVINPTNFDFNDEGEEVVSVKDPKQVLLEKSVNLIDEANKYMTSVKTKTLDEEVEENKDSKRYQLREGETLTAEVTDENGHPNKIEIDFDGSKRIINSDGKVSKGRAVLDEVGKDEEKIMEVGPEDLELGFELPDLSVLTESEEMDEQGPTLAA